MASGIALPLRAVNGRLERLAGDAYTEQLIALALGDGESENPFQEVGLGEFMIHGINDQDVEGEIRQRVRQSLAALERDQLARLAQGARSIRFERRGVEKVMIVTYENMETGQREDLDVPLPPEE